MSEHFKSLVAGGGAAVGTLVVKSPYDLTPIAEVDTEGAEGVEKALSTAYSLYRDRAAWLPVTGRIEILERAIVLMKARAESLALEAAREGGKPLVDSRVEMARAIDSLRLCVDCLRNEAGAMIPMGINAASSGRLAFTQREPIGVVVAVSAFNHPLNLIAHQVGPAVAAGCPVIVKPAEDTPLSCFRLIGILHEAGLPVEWCQALVTDDLSSAERLVSDPRVGFLTFIGSAKVGWMLRSKLSPGTRCALEHGGVAPVILAEDADLDDAIPKLIKGGLYHAGQVCVSVQRVFAPAAMAGELAQRLADAAQRLCVGDPTQEGTDVGPLIRPAEVTRVAKWIDQARAEGAEILTGGRALSESTYGCTVLYKPSPDSTVSTQEIFGPAICVYPYLNTGDAIAQANSLPYAFQAAVFTRKIETAMRLGRDLDASAVMVNDHTAFRTDWMPFAGLRESGLGVGGIPYTFRDMQTEKMLVFNSAKLA